MRVLVGCEFSGIVRDAFRAEGHEAWSVDLLETESPSEFHIRGDVVPVAYRNHWDMAIFFPPCTHLAVSGARWFPKKKAEQLEALAFVRKLLSAPIERIALENPVSIISSRIRSPDQTFQPWEFGHGEVKRTCLWLKNLPKLKPTDIVSGRATRVHSMAPGPNRWRDRSRTFAGVARAMASQWGGGAPMTASTEETYFQRADRERRELMLRLIADGASPHMRIGRVLSPNEALDVVNVAARSAAALIEALSKWETGR